MKLITRRIRAVQFFSIFCCSSLLCVAQDGYRGELMRWNQFPFDSLWQFYSGNDTGIAKLPGNYDGWQTVNTEFLPDVKGKPANWKGVGWFRKTLEVPAAWRGKPVALRMGHYGASEIFLDGKLVAQYGVVAGNIKNEKIEVPHKPVIIVLDSQPSHTIIVHYSNQHENSPGYPVKFTGFRLLFAPSDIPFQTSVTEVPTLPISVGIMFLFSVFFLFVFLFDTKRLASILTALMLLNFCCVLIGSYLLLTLQCWDALMSATNLIKITSVWSNCWLLLVLYALYYDGKMPRRAWFIVGFMLLSALIALISTSFSNIGGVLSLLLIFEIYRILISGIRKKKTGFWILLIGNIIQQIGFFVFVLDIFNQFPIMTRTQDILLMVFPQLGAPLTYALHLAWEFGKTNRDLRLQLIQVKDLSSITLQQELEKQEILTQQKDKLENMVTDRTKELSQQKEVLQNTLTDLKATQSQLIQSEKMASLGELTAGIAHEIQNPLNFVNNFSEVSNEMVDEMNDELDKGDIAEAKAIATDIKQNLEKINHHGKRADAIVKGMLQHSQTSTGKKEPTNINALADEYLRLAYHGLRAKDKGFNATLKTEFNESIGNINIIPQDIGRVLLNLYNNAFYAVAEKKKMQPDGYEPIVSVTTSRSLSFGEGRGEVRLSVKDNGNGIPQKIVDKIFQPFFTTKPTGQGTGLGLSLSYDIVKANGAEIKVESKEGEGTEFTIQLPVS